ncbi:MAG TPA: ABC transporter permease subunit [Deltaproteobacteria bacterium]|nr:ABC transporter permease subunit [Deltaproteobacteria bacterium]HQI81113.1 ABC transporter permease subunit [Deltaproteobacteria bacterium]
MVKSRFRNFAVGSTMLWITVFVVVPYLFVVLYSFLERDPAAIIAWNFDLAGYREIFSPVFLVVCWYSLLLALGTTVISLLAGYPFAFILARMPRPLQRMGLLLMIIPFWTSSLIRTYALIILMKANGIINTALLSLGLIEEPLNMLYTQTAVFVGLVYTLLPFMVLPLYTSIQKLDTRLIEAARDLGAANRHIFTRIIVPLTMPGIVAGSTMVFLPALGLFYIPDLLGGAQTMLIGNFIKNQFLTTVNWPAGSAASVVLTVIMCLFLYVYFLSSRKAHTSGMGDMA